MKLDARNMCTTLNERERRDEGDREEDGMGTEGIKMIFDLSQAHQMRFEAVVPVVIHWIEWEQK